MNFLAHIHLSGDNDYIKVGNFIADGIRGKNLSKFHPEIRKGIILHRAIDTFTDAHSIFRESTKRLHQPYGHYSGVIIDLYYDHFLAKNWANYSAVPLEKFTTDFYSFLENNLHQTTDRVRTIFPYMVKDNWLLKYQTFDGISNILYQMDRRTRFKSNMQHAHKELEIHYDAFENEFERFFIEVTAHAQTFLHQK